MDLALPLAISFYTLQQIAFLIDTYEGAVKEKDFLNYAVFVTFFPQLIAGPIVHHKEMMPQFESLKNKVKNYKNISLGMFIFSIGLFKKIIIADTFALAASKGFDTTTTLNLLEAWATSLSYTFQIYFDFSGYMDMAIGAALLFNIKLPINFNSPYKATGIIDFWQRWHITLTNFITAYIYTPMVKSFKNLTFEKAMFATVITFLIAGLWHGASWMFIIFGILHGLGLVVNHYWRKSKIKMHKVLAWFITFNFLNITLVIFRAEEWSDAMRVLGYMFSFEHIVLPNFLSSKLEFLNQYGIQFVTELTPHMKTGDEIILWLSMSFIIVLFCKNSTQKLDTFRVSSFNIVTNVLFFVVAILYMGTYTEFIYFNF